MKDFFEMLFIKSLLSIPKYFFNRTAKKEGKIEGERNRRGVVSFLYCNDGLSADTNCLGNLFLGVATLFSFF